MIEKIQNIKKATALFLIIFAFSSCLGKKGDSNSNISGNLITHAKGFTYEKNTGYDYIRVINPWDTSRILSSYVLIHKDSILPENLPVGTIVRVPVERVSLYSAVDAGVLSMLGELNRVVAVCEPQYIAIKEILDGVSSGAIIDLGQTSKPNIESVIISKSDLIFTTPFKDTNYGALEQLGVPLAECANYMEKTSLGRSEWIKFYAAFFDKYDYADSLFNEINSRYNKVKEIVQSESNRPTLLVEKRYGQVWYVPGGGSYAAKLYNDAGANYPWIDDESTGSLSLSFEEVFSKASNADVWIFRYFKQDGDLTLEELKNEYESYSKFKPFIESNVYGCNTATTPYYIYAPLNPDLELQDIAKILYPNKFKDVDALYYKKLK